MADIIDDSHEIEQTFLRSALSTKRPVGPAPNGCCHYCNGPLTNGQRFCDADCRDDYDKVQRRDA